MQATQARQNIRIIGAPVDSGGPTAGCLMGPEALRRAGLIEALRRDGREVTDAGDLAISALSAVTHPNPAVRQLAASAQWVRSLQDAAYRHADGRALPVFLGGDHLMAAGTIPALARRAAEQQRPLFVLWLDAHTDFHTLDSTETGNLHGVPAAYVCGEPGFEAAFPALREALDPARLCMLGIRSVDPAERRHLGALHTRIIDMPALRAHGVAAALQPFLDEVAASNGLLHLSFDIDCLDPAVAPGVSTRVDGGLSLTEARQIMQILHDSALVSSVDVAELNPALDSQAQSARVVVDLLGRLLQGAGADDDERLRGQVAWLSVEDMRELVLDIGIEDFLAGLAHDIERAFGRWPEFDKTARIPAHSPEGVIELMPIADASQYAFKYVNGHPKNTRDGLQTVTAFGCLADMDTGYPLLISEMTLLTALRTAATSAMAARHLARRDARCMAIIGNGAQSEFQAMAFKALLGIRTLRLYDTEPQATQKCARNLQALGFDITCCHSVQEAVRGADIITTVTADKQLATILADAMIGPGVHINAVGGDSPGKTELDPAILLRADIFVEFPPQTRIEGEIQQLAPDHPVTELWQVMRGMATGRSNDQAITVFDSVGFALEDYAALRYVHDRMRERGGHQTLSIVASPDDPRNLFGELIDVASPEPSARAALAARAPAG